MARGDASARWLPPGFKWIAYNIDGPAYVIAAIITLLPFTVVCWAFGKLFHRPARPVVDSGATPATARRA